MASKFRMNPNLVRALEQSVEVRNAQARKAEQGAEEARQLAPVSDDPENPTPGSFRDSIKAEGNKFYSDDPAAPYIEFGTSDTPAHATLRRAAESLARGA